MKTTTINWQYNNQFIKFEKFQVIISGLDTPACSTVAGSFRVSPIGTFVLSD